MFKFIIRPIKERLAARKLRKGHKERMAFPAKFAGYDPQVALYLAKLSEWAYPYGKAVSTDYESHQNFLVDMEDKKKKALIWGFKNFNYIFSEDLNILAFILHDGPNIIIDFRGTVINSNINWQTDLQAQLMEITSCGCVHKGFCEALDSIWAGIKSHISPRKKHRIWITGHSLGGALALMAGARIISEYKSSPHIIINGIYVFAAPRVGDRDFAQAFKSTYVDKRTFVFVHHNDIITVVPPFIQKISEYVNVGNILYIDCEGAITPIDDLPEFKILRQFITGYFKEQFLGGFNKEKLVHDWQSFKHFFSEVFAEIIPVFSKPLKESEHWSRFKNFFTKELPAGDNEIVIGLPVSEDAVIKANPHPHNQVAEKEKGAEESSDGKQNEHGKLSEMIRELFAELFIELNPYVVESHDIATYVKSLEKEVTTHLLR